MCRDDDGASDGGAVGVESPAAGKRLSSGKGSGDRTALMDRSDIIGILSFVYGCVRSLIYFFPRKEGERGAAEAKTEKGRGKRNCAQKGGKRGEERETGKRNEECVSQSGLFVLRYRRRWVPFCFRFL